MTAGSAGSAGSDGFGAAADAKAALRRQVLATRALLSEEDRRAAGAALVRAATSVPALATAGCVAAYASFGTEPDTGGLRAVLRSRGASVLLPVVTGATTLAWAPDDGTTAPAGPLRLPQPVGRPLPRGSLAAADVVLVPALAVDTAGRRLGRGRGYYDRALAEAAAGALVVAVVYDDEVLDAATSPVPAEPHDVPVDAALTPTRYLPLRHPR